MNVYQVCYASYWNAFLFIFVSVYSSGYNIWVSLKKKKKFAFLWLILDHNLTLDTFDLYYSVLIGGMEQVEWDQDS